MKERVDNVSTSLNINKVIPDAPLIVDHEWITAHRIDLVVHGDDFSGEMKQLCYKIPIDLGIFRLVPYTSNISTTDIIKRIKKHMGNC